MSLASPWSVITVIAVLVALASVEELGLAGSRERFY